MDYVNENVTDGTANRKYDIVPAAVAEKSASCLQYCLYRRGEMEEKLSGYLEVLKAQNPQAVGGEVPNHDFYYIQ